jgi:hypothetical protein
MARKLTGNVVLRNPETAALEVLQAGQDVPSWASGLIGDHLLEDKPAPRKSAKADDSE